MLTSCVHHVLYVPLFHSRFTDIAVCVAEACVFEECMSCRRRKKPWLVSDPSSSNAANDALDIAFEGAIQSVNQGSYRDAMLRAAVSRRGEIVGIWLVLLGLFMR
ncbi:hypothetical protein QVD17_08901 [Tagetes erecta]|uniref:Uncharacterized protein n=1 Tax=Tagetes erecta TaxID=13708 RepID=A0AAD8L0L0_TARER|nr:hypothetical protein QVD17_08901 [Tagetes erecta]